MLKNDYLVVKIGVDTAENEPSKVEPLSKHSEASAALRGEETRGAGGRARQARDRLVLRHRLREGAPLAAEGRPVAPPGALRGNDLAPKCYFFLYLKQFVLGCINADFHNQICIVQLYFFKIYKSIWLNFQNLAKICQ